MYAKYTMSFRQQRQDQLPLFGSEPLPMFGEPIPFSPPMRPNFSARKKLQRKNVPPNIVTNPPRFYGPPSPPTPSFVKTSPKSPPSPTKRTSSLKKKPFKIPGEQYGQFATGKGYRRASTRTSSLKDKRPTIKKSPSKTSLGLFGALSPKSR